MTYIPARIAKTIIRWTNYSIWSS